jgi:hypothetical protein
VEVSEDEDGFLAPFNEDEKLDDASYDTFNEDNSEEDTPDELDGQKEEVDKITLVQNPEDGPKEDTHAKLDHGPKKDTHAKLDHQKEKVNRAKRVRNHKRKAKNVPNEKEIRQALAHLRGQWWLNN